MEEWFIDYIKGFENFKSKPYWDKTGWAIGYGSHYYEDGTPVKENDSGITIDKANQLVKNYLKNNEPKVAENFPNWNLFPKLMQYALMDIAYKAGPGIKTTSPHLTEAINTAYEDGKVTYQEMQDILKEIELAGLKYNARDRKERDIAMFLNRYNPEHNNTINRLGGLGGDVSYYTGIRDSFNINPNYLLPEGEKSIIYTPEDTSSENSNKLILYLRKVKNSKPVLSILNLLKHENGGKINYLNYINF